MDTYDLFPDTLPPNYADDDEARQMIWAAIKRWFGTLCYAHSEATHAEILDSLGWQGMRDAVADSSLLIHDSVTDFDTFADGVRQQARRARAAGLVVPDGKPRPRATCGTGGLFGEGL